MALGLLVLAGLHAFAAIKHHCVDRDKVLRRMISWK
jgi:cytochrome b561